MSRTVPLLYGAAVTILVVAGVLLSMRSAALTPATSRVPDGCAEVRRPVAETLFPAAEVEPDDRVDDDGVHYARWVDATDGELLIELRCTRVAFPEVLEQRRALDRASGSDELTLLETSPPATLTRIPAGVVLRQIDEDTRIERRWFVARELDAHEAAVVVEADDLL